jgi:adenosine deaminase
VTSAAATEGRVDEHALRRLPKAEVHIHLEGTFSLASIMELSRVNRVPLPRPARRIFDFGGEHGDAATPSGAGTGADAGGLGGFLGFLDWQCSLVMTAEQAARIAYAAAARLTASGVRYADLIVNPAHWRPWRGRELLLLDALAGGFTEAEQDGLCAAGLCYSLLRTQTAQEARDIVAELLARRPRRVVALSVDGDEHTAGRTGQKFAAAFTAARDGGLRRTVHAGESSGPEGVRDAITLLHAERIDHGVRSVEDPSLVAELAERGIPLGVCPRSNVALGIYPDWPSHPLRQLVEAGVAVTLNTDDPAPLGTTLEADWAVCAAEFGFDLRDMTVFARRSIEASFADDSVKRELLAELSASAGWPAQQVP